MPLLSLMLTLPCSPAGDALSVLFLPRSCLESNVHLLSGCLMLSLKKHRREQHRPPLQLLISNGLLLPKVLRVLICPLSLLIYSLTPGFVLCENLFC